MKNDNKVTFIVSTTIAIPLDYYAIKMWLYYINENWDSGCAGLFLPFVFIFILGYTICIAFPLTFISVGSGLKLLSEHLNIKKKIKSRNTKKYIYQKMTFLRDS